MLIAAAYSPPGKQRKKAGWGFFFHQTIANGGNGEKEIRAKNGKSGGWLTKIKIYVIMSINRNNFDQMIMNNRENIREMVGEKHP